MRSQVVLLGSATAVVAQFGFEHTQYDTSPPVYPSREFPVHVSPKSESLIRGAANITGVGGWEAALGKARTFVGALTLEEKARMVTGKPVLFCDARSSVVLHHFLPQYGTRSLLY
jgi:beta-glucosidase